MNILDMAPATATAAGVSDVDVQKGGLGQQSANTSGSDAPLVDSSNAKTPFNVHLSNEQRALKDGQTSNRAFALQAITDKTVDQVLTLSTPTDTDLLPIALSNHELSLDDQTLDVNVDTPDTLLLPSDLEPVPVLGNQVLVPTVKAAEITGVNDAARNPNQGAAAILSFQQLGHEVKPAPALQPEVPASQVSALASASSEKADTQAQMQPLLQGKTQLQQNTKQNLNFDVELSKAFDLNIAADSDELPASRLTSANSLSGLGAPFESSVANSVSPARFQVNVQFGRAEWMADVAAQVSKLAAQNLNFAEIQLDPPELGSLQVRVQLNNDQAAVSFTAQSAQVREALEQNGHRLREMFSADGMNLVDVDVRDQNQHKQQDELDSETVGSHNEAGEEMDSSDTRVVNVHAGVGVDDYV